MASFVKRWNSNRSAQMPVLQIEVEVQAQMPLLQPNYASAAWRPLPVHHSPGAAPWSRGGSGAA